LKTLEQVKKEKNYLAHVKGYPMDPEGFSFKFLFNRFYDELGELQTITEDLKIGNLIPESRFFCNDEIMTELADLSNFIDYIATKIITGYPTKYEPSKQGLRELSER
jgi:hypothetical protein